MPPSGLPSPPLRADARRNRASILAAAEAVFAARGAAASTEEVARRAGVAIGTVFRHFPAKDDLLRAIMKDLLERLSAEAAALAADGDPGTALFTFFSRLVEQAAAKRTVIDLLAEAGTSIDLAGPVQGLRIQVAELLTLARRAGTVRADVQLDEVLALLVAASQGAVQASWDSDLQERVLAVIFAGLRPERGPGGLPAAHPR